MVKKNGFLNNENKCFIIAEAGSNHNGSLAIAKRMIEVASEAGADAVKFQLFRARTMYPKKSAKVGYLKNIGIDDDLYAIIKRFEIPYYWIKNLYEHCREYNIKFMATPFDLEAVRILNPYVDIFKIASYEALYVDLINEVKKTKKPLLISVGGCTEDEVDALVDGILYDYKDKSVLLHCLAKYPAPIEQANLGIIPYMAQRYDLNIGYSDHTSDPVIAPVAARSMGAEVLEKHFTLSKKLPGPDHAFAVEPDELKDMVVAVRMIEKGITPQKKRIVQKCERELYFYKRCLYSRKVLIKGERIKKSDLIVLRNIGRNCRYFNPIEINSVIGRIVRRKISAYEVIKREDLL